MSVLRRLFFSGAWRSRLLVRAGSSEPPLGDMQAFAGTTDEPGLEVHAFAGTAAEPGQRIPIFAGTSV